MLCGCVSTWDVVIILVVVVEGCVSTMVHLVLLCRLQDWEVYVLMRLVYCNSILN